MFIDQAKIWVKAGDGGNGCCSFRREKFVPKGGPDGGDGGKGGDVYLQTDKKVDTLLDFAGKHHWQAGNGKPGQGGNKNGADGEDLVIKVPPGTLVYDDDLGLLLKDMNKPDMKTLICRAGTGGKGNKAFATSTNQAPRYTEPGKKGQQRNLRLELKLIADVGLIGLPNAGKSTLISRCSKAKPKIAAYPFTTLEPVLGIVELPDFRRFVMADIPGLIENAHNGAGLGYEFLRHIERTKILVHIIDIVPLDKTAPFENYKTIREEISEYNKELANKPEIIALNKIDLEPESENIKNFSEKIGKQTFPISAVTGKGIDRLNEQIWKMLENSDQKVK